MRYDGLPWFDSEMRLFHASAHALASNCRAGQQAAGQELRCRPVTDTVQSYRQAAFGIYAEGSTSHHTPTSEGDLQHMLRWGGQSPSSITAGSGRVQHLKPEISQQEFTSCAPFPSDTSSKL